MSELRNEADDDDDDDDDVRVIMDVVIIAIIVMLANRSLMNSRERISRRFRNLNILQKPLIDQIKIQTLGWWTNTS